MPEGLKKSYLKDYVLNRDEILSNIATAFDCTTYHAKQLVLCVMMGGNIKTWIKRYLGKFIFHIKNKNKYTHREMRLIRQQYLEYLLFSSESNVLEMRKWLNNFRIEIDFIITRIMHRFPLVTKEAEAFHSVSETRN